MPGIVFTLDDKTIIQIKLNPTTRIPIPPRPLLLHVTKIAHISGTKRFILDPLKKN